MFFPPPAPRDSVNPATSFLYPQLEHSSAYEKVNLIEGGGFLHEEYFHFKKGGYLKQDTIIYLTENPGKRFLIPAQEYN